jgi:hypothetical protein
MERGVRGRGTAKGGVTGSDVTPLKIVLVLVLFLFLFLGNSRKERTRTRTMAEELASLPVAPWAKGYGERSSSLL